MSSKQAEHNHTHGKADAPPRFFLSLILGAPPSNLNVTSTEAGAVQSMASTVK